MPESWRALTEDDVDLNAAEDTAYRESLLRSGQANRLTRLLASTTRRIRDAIRSNRDNVLDPDPTTVPESAVEHASSIIVFRLMANFPGGISEPRKMLHKEALDWLRDVAAGRVLVEAPGESGDTPAPPKARPRITRPTLTQRREDAAGS